MINKLLNISTRIYPSNLTLDNLNHKIEDVFQQSDLSFAGKFTGKNEFKVYDRWNYITWEVPNFKRKTAYLKGNIVETTKGSLLMLNTKPNTLITIFPLLFLISGTTTIILTGANIENRTTLIFGLIVIAFSIIFYITGILLRVRLQNNFKKYLDL